MCLMSGPKIAKVLKTSLIAALFAFVIFLPSALWGNWPVSSQSPPRCFFQ